MQSSSKQVTPKRDLPPWFPLGPGFPFNYRMAGNFGGKIFWRIAENMSFGGIYFGG